MSLPIESREKWCYEKCEELAAQTEQLGYVLQDIEVDHDVSAVNAAEIVAKLREIQGKLAAIALK